MRLLAGLVAGFDWETVLIGDESLSGRPMDRVAEPLGAHGGRGDGTRRALPAPAVASAAARCDGIDWTSKWPARR